MTLIETQTLSTILQQYKEFNKIDNIFFNLDFYLTIENMCTIKLFDKLHDLKFKQQTLELEVPINEYGYTTSYMDYIDEFIRKFCNQFIHMNKQIIITIKEVSYKIEDKITYNIHYNHIIFNN